MSDDTADADDSGSDTDAETPALDEEGLDDRLDDAESALEEAETEADLDEVADQLDALENALEEADLPTPEDEDEEAPADRLEARLSDLRDDLEAQRGPYLEDVTAILDDAAGSVPDAEWTEDGEDELAAAVETFFESANETVDAGLTLDAADPDGIAAALSDASDELADYDLHPDSDGETIQALLDAAETLEDDIDAAEVWSDLTVREQLDAQGFYDVLDPENRKDYPAEWNAVKIYEKLGEVEPILTALDRFESDFMEENVLTALEHIAPEEAFEPIHERAQKRDNRCVRILGRIGDERACETLEDFLGGGDYKLELVTLRSLGAIGCTDSTQAVADRLTADNDDVRSAAARALGRIGDTRAIDPLADVLADDEADEVRASAAWALNQIGTERALDAAAEYTDDRSYIVQAEAEKAAGV